MCYIVVLRVVLQGSLVANLVLGMIILKRRYCTYMYNVMCTKYKIVHFNNVHDLCSSFRSVLLSVRAFRIFVGTDQYKLKTHDFFSDISCQSIYLSL